MKLFLLPLLCSFFKSFSCVFVFLCIFCLFSSFSFAVLSLNEVVCSAYLWEKPSHRKKNWISAKRRCSTLPWLIILHTRGSKTAVPWNLLSAIWPVRVLTKARTGRALNGKTEKDSKMRRERMRGDLEERSQDINRGFLVQAIEDHLVHLNVTHFSTL